MNGIGAAPNGVGNAFNNIETGGGGGGGGILGKSVTIDEFVLTK